MNPWKEGNFPATEIDVRSCKKAAISYISFRNTKCQSFIMASFICWNYSSKVQTWFFTWMHKYLIYVNASWGRNTIDRALASHHEGRGSNLGGANKCPCTSSLNYMPWTKLRSAYGAPPRSLPGAGGRVPKKKVHCLHRCIRSALRGMHVLPSDHESDHIIESARWRF